MLATHAPLLAAADPFTVVIDGQTNDSWSTVLGALADANLYQSWAYGAVHWSPRQLSHFVLRTATGVQAAAQLRLLRVPGLRAGIAHLRWGPLCRRPGEPLDPACFEAAVRGLVREYCDRRRLTLRLIPHLYPAEPEAEVLRQALARAGLQPAPRAAGHRTVLVDLTPDLDTLRRRLDKKWRNQLTHAERNGLSLVDGEAPELYREFTRLYAGMKERKRFSSTVDIAEFPEMQRHLAPHDRLRIFLAQAGGTTIGALVCSPHGDGAIYLLGATDEKGRELKAAYLLQWAAIQWCKQRGTRTYDLGGINPVTNPGVYHFKSGLGGVEAQQLAPHVRFGGGLSRLLYQLLLRRRPA